MRLITMRTQAIMKMVILIWLNEKESLLVKEGFSDQFQTFAMFLGSRIEKENGSRTTRSVLH
jgi:hypothetical protein